MEEDPAIYASADAVIYVEGALYGVIGGKGCVDGDANE